MVFEPSAVGVSDRHQLDSPLLLEPLQGIDEFLVAERDPLSVPDVSP